MLSEELTFERLPLERTGDLKREIEVPITMPQVHATRPSSQTQRYFGIRFQYCLLFTVRTNIARLI